VGSDFPNRALRLYRSIGIDLDGLQKVKGETFRWSGVYEADMNNRRTLKTCLNVFESFYPKLPASYRKCPFLFLANIAPALQSHVLSELQKPEFVAADTMDLWINTGREALMEVIARVQMLMLNESEARLLTDRHNLIQAAKRILEWGPAYVVVKKGEHGAMLFSRDGVFLLPAYPVEDVRDPTGAGDAFAGGFMGALAGGSRTDERAIRSALRVGTVIASFAVESFGLDRLSAISRDDVVERLTAYKRMVRG
jgi:cytidine kinase